MKNKFTILISLFGLCFCYSFQSIAQDQPSNNPSIECTDTFVDYKDDASLTSEERIALMNEAFFTSLNKYDSCQLSQSNNNASSSAGLSGASAANGEEGGAGAEGSNDIGQSQSVASSDMSGDEPAAEYDQTISGEQGSSSWGESEDNDGNDSQITKNKIQDKNGKTPDDIPPADNDSILESQIRYAAENEPDPVKREKLWDEYRKYKGLPAAS